MINYEVNLVNNYKKRVYKYLKRFEDGSEKSNDQEKRLDIMFSCSLPSTVPPRM